jgi:ubiquinone/menaquinone biosynthesis C-methylase UbiE
MSIRDRIKSIFGRDQTEPASAAYDKWSKQYDNQPGNLVLDLDEEVFSTLISSVTLEGMTIVDVGCGTGRHWKKIMAGNPARVVGYDASTGMLEKLKQKFPGAEVYVPQGYSLKELKDRSCDILISTLTLAHIPGIENVTREWNRVLKPGGQIIYTDYHPESLAKGGKRTFMHEGKAIEVKSFIYPLEEVRFLFSQLGFKELRFSERVVDDKVKRYYELQNVVELYNRFRNVPVIYGLHLKKNDDIF